MTKSRSYQRKRSILVRGAIERVHRQPTFRRFCRAFNFVCHSLLHEACFWIFQASAQLIPTVFHSLRATRNIPITPSKSSPTVDTYQPTCDTNPQTSILYIPGGAWTSTNALHYSQLGSNLSRAINATVHIVSYPHYPHAHIEKQVEAVICILEKYCTNNQNTILIAHSSGAHVTALALFKLVNKNNDSNNKQSNLPKLVILTAGPFHLMHHFLYESHRGVAQISPLLPASNANRNISHFDELSPTILAETSSLNLQETNTLPPAPIPLEGLIAASNFDLPSPIPIEQNNPASFFPRMYILTSSSDSVVPMYSSLRFATALRKLGLPVHLLVYDNMQHIDFVTDWFHNSFSRIVTNILDITNQDEHRRKQCVMNIMGKQYQQLFQPDQSSTTYTPQTPYTRDIIRILLSITNNSHDQV